MIMMIPSPPTVGSQSAVRNKAFGMASKRMSDRRRSNLYCQQQQQQQQLSAIDDNRAPTKPFNVMTPFDGDAVGGCCSLVNEKELLGLNNLKITDDNEPVTVAIALSDHHQDIEQSASAISDCNCNCKRALDWRLSSSWSSPSLSTSTTSYNNNNNRHRHQQEYHNSNISLRKPQTKESPQAKTSATSTTTNTNTRQLTLAATRRMIASSAASEQQVSVPNNILFNSDGAESADRNRDSVSEQQSRNLLLEHPLIEHQPSSFVQPTSASSAIGQPLVDHYTFIGQLSGQHGSFEYPSTTAGATSNSTYQLIDGPEYNYSGSGEFANYNANQSPRGYMDNERTDLLELHSSSSTGLHLNGSCSSVTKEERIVNVDNNTLNSSAYEIPSDPSFANLDAIPNGGGISTRYQQQQQRQLPQSVIRVNQYAQESSRDNNATGNEHHFSSSYQGYNAQSVDSGHQSVLNSSSASSISHQRPSASNGNGKQITDYQANYSSASAHYSNTTSAGNRACIAANHSDNLIDIDGYASTSHNDVLITAFPESSRGLSQDLNQHHHLNHHHHHHQGSSLMKSHDYASSHGDLHSIDSSSHQLHSQDNEIKVCEWEECGCTFMDMSLFVKHLEDEHVNQTPKIKNRYFCLWRDCKRNEQEFNARYKLLIHMRVHSGEKPYPCKNENCKKSFSRLENLKIHVRSHTGEKPYKCNYQNCLKSFTNSSDRIKHHKTHRDPKPYACAQNGCSKRYTDPSSLRKHLRAHKRASNSTTTKHSTIYSNQPAHNILYHQEELAHSQDQQHPHQYKNHQQHLQLDSLPEQAPNGSYSSDQQQQQHFDCHQSNAQYLYSTAPANTTTVQADYDPTSLLQDVMYSEQVENNDDYYNNSNDNLLQAPTSSRQLQHEHFSRSWCASSTYSSSNNNQCYQDEPTSSRYPNEPILNGPNSTSGQGPACPPTCSQARRASWRPSPHQLRQAPSWSNRGQQHSALMRSLPPTIQSVASTSDFRPNGRHQANNRSCSNFGDHANNNVATDQQQRIYQNQEEQA